MDYSNSKTGFKRLFLAEMLMIAADVVALFVKKAEILSIVAIIGMFVAFIVNLFGLKKMAKDEEGYMSAFLCAIGSVAIVGVSMFIMAFSPKDTLAYVAFDNFSKTGSKVTEYFTVYYVLKTSINVAEKLSKTDLMTFTKKTLTIYTIAFASSVILQTFNNPYAESTTTLVLILGLLSSILGVVSQIVYYVFLKKMADNL